MTTNEHKLETNEHKLETMAMEGNTGNKVIQTKGGINTAPFSTKKT